MRTSIPLIRAWVSMLERLSSRTGSSGNRETSAGAGPGVDLAQVQQVAEQVEHVVHRVADRPEALLDLGVGVAVEVELEQLRRQDHGVQRGPRVVRERRDQARLVPRGLLGQLALPLQGGLELDPLGDVADGRHGPGDLVGRVGQRGGVDRDRPELAAERPEELFLGHDLAAEGAIDGEE